MKRTYHFLLPLLSLFLVRVDLTDLVPLNLSVKSVEVIDGDTVLVSFGGKAQHRLRLMHIDAPERGQRPLNSNLDLGAYSTKCLKKMIGSAKKLTIHGYDRYHRMLGELDDLSFQLVLAGCAYIYEYAKFNDRQQKTQFLVAQNKAQHFRRGLWKFKVLNPRLYRKKQFRSQ